MARGHILEEEIGGNGVLAEVLGEAVAYSRPDREGVSLGGLVGVFRVELLPIKSIH